MECFRIVVAARCDRMALPAAAAAVATSPAPVPDAAFGLLRLTALVMDDQADARELLGTVLTRAGLRVVQAQSAAEALERLAAADVDLLLADIGMPEVDGYDGFCAKPFDLAGVLSVIQDVLRRARVSGALASPHAAPRS
jgi:DNA-binding response OmpR family regulator